jgi:hypothetical protein
VKTWRSETTNFNLIDRSAIAMKITDFRLNTVNQRRFAVQYLLQPSDEQKRIAASAGEKPTTIACTSRCHKVKSKTIVGKFLSKMSKWKFLLSKCLTTTP